MRVLLLGMYMQDRHGSVLHILEYATFFKSIGAEVHIGAVFINNEMRATVEEAGFHLTRINNVPLEEEYDLVYALHLFLFPYLLYKDLKYKRSILGLLSPSIPLEQLPPSCMWPYYDLITAISSEIIFGYQKEYAIDSANFTLIPNPVPLEFLEKANVKKSWRPAIKKVAVVSNHKLDELADMARNAPWQTDFFGLEYGNSVAITAELLLDYDVIITIGKTVQYAMSLGLPVFEYDHFGGCGYINPQNMETEALMNFSGRATRTKMTGEELREAMEGGYQSACQQAPALRSMAIDKFSIIKLATLQMKLMATKPPRHEIVLTPDARFFCNACHLAIEHLLGLMKMRRFAALD